jgi:hypothetical protein
MQTKQNKKNILGMDRNEGATSFMGVTKLQMITHLRIKWYRFKYSIQLGSWLEFLIEIFTLGKGEDIALWIAKKVFKKNSCGCCERKQWLNRLTNPYYDGRCNEIKLY